jgi:hypothetical protein
VLNSTSLIIDVLFKVVVSPETCGFPIAFHVKLLAGLAVNGKLTLLPEQIVPELEFKIGKGFTVIVTICDTPLHPLTEEIGVTE